MLNLDKHIHIHPFFYLILVLLLVGLLPQLPVEVQPAFKHGRRSDTQGEEQQAPQHQACKHTHREEKSGCHLTFYQTAARWQSRRETDECSLHKNHTERSDDSEAAGRITDVLSGCIQFKSKEDKEGTFCSNMNKMHMLS